jgi:CheY-like chemotaxis protein
MSEDQRPSADPPGRTSVLVVDDDPEHRLSCRDRLEQEGFLVTEASDGKKALNLLTERRSALPDIILLDLSMPHMDGWQFLAIIKSYLRLRSIPVVLLSGHEPELDPVRHGAVAAYVRKPYDPDQLVALIRKLAGG